MENFVKSHNSNEIILYGGRWTSYIGNKVFDYANTILITTMTSTHPIVLGVYQALDTIVQLVFNLIGGAISDLNSQKKVLVVTDLVSALMCFVLSFLIDSELGIPSIIIFNCFLAISSAFNSPAYKSIIKNAIRKDRIIKYNAISDVGNQIVEIAGPLLGIVVVNLYRSRGAMIFNAITFAISAILEMHLFIEDTSNFNKRKNKIIKHVIEGFIYLSMDKQAFLIIIVASFVNFFCAGFNLLVPYTKVLFADCLPNSYEMILVTEAIAGIIGSLFVARFSNTKIISEKYLLIYLNLAGVSLLFIPVILSFNGGYFLLVPFFLLPFFISLFNITLMSYIQVTVDSDYLGRVFSIMSTFSLLFVPLGAICFSLIVDVIKVGGFLIISIGIIVLSLSGILLSKRINSNSR